MSPNTDLIQSNHLDLVLLDSKSLQLSLEENSEALERILNADIHPDWFKKKELIALRYEQIIRMPVYQPWSPRAIILRKERKMIGHIGFHTQPAPSYLHSFATNGIEYGFTIFPDFRRNGYATEASVALMTWAYQQHLVSEFILTINPNNISSLKLAQRLGFKKIGSHMDETEGMEDIYKLDYRHLK
ncbi:MAG TPA: GNAT family N-acetyltransferase [Anaerolineales bacterium]